MDSESDYEESDEGAERSDGSSYLSADEGEDSCASNDANDVPACCGKGCLKKKSGKYRSILRSVNAMSKTERVTSILSSLSLSAAFSAEQSASSDGESNQSTPVHERFAYYAPVIGRVCKEGIQKIFKISHRTLTLYRKRALLNEVSPKPHGNLGDSHAKRIDDEAVRDWLEEMAAIRGEVVGVRVRRVMRDDDTVRLVSRAENFMLLPANLTWDYLYDEFKTFIAEEVPGESVCSRRSLVRIARQRCPNLRIRAPRDNVCDVCCILRSRLPAEVTAEETEGFALHVIDAKSMRAQYKSQCENASDDHYVFTIDFAQNLTLHNVSETPSAWYFMTRMSVSVFGVYYHNSKKQYNYLYTERRAGKGGNEVISMLHRTLQREGIVQDSLPEKPKTVTVWADNCGGQNKNFYVLAYLRLLTDVGVVREANLNFLVKGHMKNACDRGFGEIKRHALHNDAWILADLVNVVDEASSGVEAECLEDDANVFANVKPFLVDKLYKKVDGIHKYQMFRMPPAGRGLVECRATPSPGCVRLLQKIVPSVPTQFQCHPFYQKPSDELEQRAKAVKDQRKKLREERTREQVAGQVGPDETSEVATSQPKRKRPRPRRADAGEVSKGKAEDE